MATHEIYGGNGCSRCHCLGRKTAWWRRLDDPSILEDTMANTTAKSALPTSHGRVVLIQVIFMGLLERRKANEAVAYGP